MKRIIGILRAPIDDYLAALDRCVRDRKFLFILLPAAVATWWIYVPVHELMHAYGCILTGGTVTRLEIDAMYGAAFLQRFFPFVAVDSQYAGQLTGFTRDNDLIYLATDAAPFLLTILVGVPLLISAAHHSPRRAALELGIAIPIAFAPFLSLIGDYYEMGSILVSRTIWLTDRAIDVERWRSDDVIKLIGQLGGEGMTALDLLAVSGGLFVAIALAWLTYWAGSQFSRMLPHPRPLPQ